MNRSDDLLLRIRSRSDAGGEIIVAIAGELDVSTASQLGNELDRLISAGATRIVIEAAGLTFMDSSGMSSLIVAHRAMQAKGGSLEIHSPSPRVLRVLEVSGVSRFIPIVSPTSRAGDEEPTAGETPPAA